MASLVEGSIHVEYPEAEETRRWKVGFSKDDPSGKKKRSDAQLWMWMIQMPTCIQDCP